jgi:hypothetical protein
LRTAVVIFLLTLILSAIVAMFWYQEGQYLLPTPVPENYKVVSTNEIIQFDKGLLPQQHTRPMLLHFFGPACPCSRFNLRHFLSLNKKYGGRIDFYVVVIDPSKVESAKEMIDEGIPILVDKQEKLAEACGVYSTPQAALLQADNKLYFRGNYNRSRFCTDKQSNFVQMAIDSILAGKTPPHFSTLATQSYGCSLSEEQNIFQIQ